MTNLTAAKSLCNAVCNTFHPDADAIRIALFNDGIDPQAEATPKDPDVFRVALRLVMGYVESSRSEGGVSTGVRSEEAIKQSIRIWCLAYGLDADEVMDGFGTVIDNASDLW